MNGVYTVYEQLHSYDKFSFLVARETVAFRWFIPFLLVIIIILLLLILSWRICKLFHQIRISLCRSREYKKICNQRGKHAARQGVPFSLLIFFRSEAKQSEAETVLLKKMLTYFWYFLLHIISFCIQNILFRFDAKQAQLIIVFAFSLPLIFVQLQSEMRGHPTCKSTHISTNNFNKMWRAGLRTSFASVYLL